MTQLFTNQGLGLTGSSLSYLGSFGPKGMAKLGQGGESVYLNAATGNLVVRQQDGFLASSGLGLELIHTYNSRGEGRQNWCFNTQSQLMIQGAINTCTSIVTRIDEDGHRSCFLYNETKGCYVAKEGGTASLTFSNDHWFYREGASLCTQEYNLEGQLIAYNDPDNHHLQFFYQAGKLSQIVDSSGEQCIAWIFHQGVLREITTTSQGKIVHHLSFNYDSYNRLQTVSRDLGDNRTYWITYDYIGDSIYLSSIRQSDGTALYIDYDSEGRVKRLVDGEGHKTSYIYDAGKTVVCNELGETWIYYYDDAGHLTGVDGPNQSSIRYEYNGNKLVAIHQGSLHWFFHYNEQGDCCFIKDPSGQITTRRYDKEHRLLSETHSSVFDDSQFPRKSKTSRFVYDESGHLRFKISSDRTVTEYRYNSVGQCVSCRTYLHTGFQMDGDVVQLSEIEGWVIQQNPQAISLIDYSYDWRGQLSEELHYTIIGIDGKGNVATAIPTYYRYDAAGKLVEKSVLFSEGMSTTHYLYDDLGRLIHSWDNQQHQESFDYDDEHQRLIITDAKGLQQIRTFDRNGLLLSLQYIVGNQQNYGTTHYCYDAAGRLVSELHPDGSSYYYFYDNEGRLLAKCEPNGQVSEYRYDAEGRLIQTLNYATPLTTMDWQGKPPSWLTVKPLASSNDRLTQQIYNDFNQIAYQIDAEGAVIAYEYNVDGQVIKKTAFAKRINLNEYDSSKLDLAASKDDRIAYFYYDSEGRLQAEINAEGAATAFRYDRRGNLLETIHYVNGISLPSTSEWQAPAKSDADIHHYRFFNAAGLKIADIDPLGYIITYRYDQRGLLVNKRSYSTPLTHPVLAGIHAETDFSSLTLQERGVSHESFYTYDDLGQLIEERTQNGLITQYTYDEKGLILNKTLIDANTLERRQQRFRYDVLGRVIQSLDALGVEKLEQKKTMSEAEIELIWQQHGLHYDYDVAGRLIRSTNALKQETHYFYNQAGLLVYTVNADGQVTAYRYNTFKQIERIRRYSRLLQDKVSDLTIEQLSNCIAALTDETADETTDYEYNHAGLLRTKTTGNQGKLTTYYNAFGEIEETHQQIGAKQELIKQYRYDRRGLLCHQFDDISGLNRDLETRYDIFGRIRMLIDGRGEKTRFTLNKRGECLILENQAKNRKLMTYDAFGRILTETDFTFVKNINQFSYDDQNNTLTLEHPGEGRKVITRFNAFGDKLSFIDGNEKITHFSYNAKGELIKIAEPEGRSQHYDYDAMGNLIWEVTAKGLVHRYRYDAAGHVLEKTVDPDGLALTTSYQYDGIGRLLIITDSAGVKKQFYYDEVGHLKQTCIDPHGLHLTIDFIYDERGLLIRQTEVNPQGFNKVTAYEWDALGRRTAVILDPDGLKLRTSYRYDKNDNLISETDANNHSLYYVYDAKNQCHFQIDARGVVKEHIYDVNGNETKTVVYAQRIPVLQEFTEASIQAVLQPSDSDQYQFRIFNRFGEIILSFDSQGYATSYDYDDNGNLIHLIRYAEAQSLTALKASIFKTPNPDGARERYFAYDGLNQLIFQLDEENYLTQFNYHPGGQLESKTTFAQRFDLNTAKFSVDKVLANLCRSPANDQCIRYCYDGAGRLTGHLSANGAVTCFCYDSLGNKIATIQYATLLDCTAEDWQARLVSSDHDRITRFLFDAAGREVYQVSAEGNILERHYDALGQVIAEIAHGQKIKGNPDSVAELREALRVASQDRITRFNYDSIGRLSFTVDAKQHLTRYGYDAKDNIISKINANGAQWIYRYNETNQLIEISSPLASVSYQVKGQWVSEERSILTRYEYDSFGNVITSIRDAEGLKQTLYYLYDNNNRLIQKLYPNVFVNAADPYPGPDRQENLVTLSEEQRYNAFGEIVASKDRAGNWRYQAYDNKGQLLYTLDAEGALVGYRYDAFANQLGKTRYAVRLANQEQKDYSVEVLEQLKESHSDDREESYQYDKDNHLIEISHQAIRTYNAASKHYDCLSPTTRFYYNAFGEVIETAIQRNEEDWARTFDYYNKDGLKIARLDAEHYLSRYSYDTFGQLIEEMHYANRAAVWDKMAVETPGNSPKDRHLIFIYNDLGQLICKINKNVTYQELRDKNCYKNMTQDLATSYTYDALGNLTSTTDALGFTTYCYYDSLGQLIAKVGPASQAGRAAISYAYDALGQLVAVTCYAKRVSYADEYEYVLTGSSADDINTYSIYDNQGYLITTIDGLNHAIHYSYDANGQVQRSWEVVSQIDSSKRLIDKRYIYDHEGHLLQTLTFKENGQAKREEASYNTFGELVAKGLNGQMTTKIDYDQLGRIWRSNTQGYYQIYLYDLMDHVTQVITSTNAFSPEFSYCGVDLSDPGFAETLRFDEEKWLYTLQRQDNLYDGLGHCLSQRKVFTVNSRQQGQGPFLEEVVETETYDRFGNMLSHQNASGYVTNYEWNAFDQVIKQELPEVTVLDEGCAIKTVKPCLYYAYDALGRAIAFTDANGHSTAKILDGKGNILAEIDAKGNTRYSTYNLLDQLQTKQNELGAVTVYRYDKANRLVEILSPDNQQFYDYDETGALISQTNALKQSLFFWYNQSGQLSKKVDVNGRTTTYEYDDAGHKTHEVDHKGLQQSWTYDEMGRLKTHRDLGGHLSCYQYNQNGLLLEETSSSGKNISYRYQGDGRLSAYTDNNKQEAAYYDYDADGNISRKTASRLSQGNDDGWLREVDEYSYDALGRLITLRRRNPEDKSDSFPEKDHALLSIDYLYDAVGNVRRTQVEANYTGYQKVTREDYYLFDENNRLLVNKGRLQNGIITLNDEEGSRLSYDEAGNLTEAQKIENGKLQTYSYHYNKTNQLQAIYKNNALLKTMGYDDAGRVIEERFFDTGGHAVKKTTMTYIGDLLKWQTTKSFMFDTWYETEKNEYYYDEVGNLQDVVSQSWHSGAFYQTFHHYCYEYWDNYCLSSDLATLSINGNTPLQSESRRHYDVNGQLFQAIDSALDGTGRYEVTTYKVSTFEGIRGRANQAGQTHYLIIGGKMIGDLQLDNYGRQRLTVYGGFTPTGSQVLSYADKMGYFSKEIRQEQTGELTQGIPANTPQDQIDAYIVKAGDDLETIAAQIYGDSSLWFLIADANGITDKNDSSQLHTGQRLIIPALATKQHQTDKTKPVLNSDQLLGDLSPMFWFPVLGQSNALASQRKPHTLFKKIAVAAVAVVATVLAAAAFATLAGVIGVSLGTGLGGAFQLGMKVLAGKAMESMLGSFAAGFAAGVTGNLASQGLARWLGLQKEVNLKGSLISGLSTAASASLLHGLNSSEAYNRLVEKFNKISPKSFSLISAAEMMEQDAVSQGVSLALQNHQHFNWYTFGAKSVLAGFGGSEHSLRLNRLLSQHIGVTGSTFINTEAGALAQAGLEASMRGQNFDAVNVLNENLGSALASGFMQSRIADLEMNNLSEAGPYCPIPVDEEGAYTPVPAGAYERFRQEAANRVLYDSIAEKANQLWSDYGDKLVTYGPRILGVWGGSSPPQEKGSDEQLTGFFTHSVKDSSLHWLKEFGERFWEAGKFENRLLGAAQVAGGALEFAGASALMAVSEGTLVGISKLGVLHSIDNIVTGTEKVITGGAANTQSHYLLKKLSFSDNSASLIENGMSFLFLGNGVQSALKTVNYGENKLFSFLKAKVLLGDKNYSKVEITPMRLKAVIGHSLLGTFAGSYEAFVSGGDRYTTGTGAIIGTIIGFLGTRRRFLGFAKSHYLFAGLSNATGQIVMHLRNPEEFQFSAISFGFSLAGSGVSNAVTRHINVPITKTVIDSMYGSAFSSVGSNLGKRTGW